VTEAASCSHDVRTRFEEEAMTSQDRPRGGLRGPEIVGLVLIGLGVLFLFDQFRWIRFGWGTFWPLILVGIGALILYGAARPRVDGQASVRIPREDSDQLALDLRLGAGRFLVRGGAAELVEAESNGRDIESSVQRSGRRAHVRIGLNRPWFPVSGAGAPDWRIAVGADVATRLDLAAGAGTFELDLSEIRLVDARISLGAAQAHLTLPRPIGEVPIRVSTGASQLTIAAPPGVELQVRTSGGLLDVSGPAETLGFATATDRVAIRVEGGAASVRVVG
jgi:hypothetical protein